MKLKSCNLSILPNYYVKDYSSKLNRFWLAKCEPVSRFRIDPLSVCCMPGCLFSFWITKKNPDLVFSTLFFEPHILDPFFQGRKPTHVFKSRIVGADWLGVYVALLNSLLDNSFTYIHSTRKYVRYKYVSYIMALYELYSTLLLPTTFITLAH